MKTPQVGTLPGMTPLGFKDETELAKRIARAPLKPTKPQIPCDHGLFSDERDQLDLCNIEMFMD